MGKKQGGSTATRQRLRKQATIAEGQSVTCMSTSSEVCDSHAAAMTSTPLIDIDPAASSNYFASSNYYYIDPAADAGLPATSKWKNLEHEPVWFHQRSQELAEEIGKGYYARSIIDFSPGSGHFAMAALAQGLPYVGLQDEDIQKER